MLKLNKIVKDKASGIKGMLTHYVTDEAGNEQYIFQPSGLNPETGGPVQAIFINEARVEGGEVSNVALPKNILGTIVEDEATGFKGTAIELTYHINGCIHFNVKPKGIIDKTGASIEAHDFDIRRLKGTAIPKITEEQKEKSQIKYPSPARIFKINR